MTKTAWIVIGIVLLVLVVIGIVYHKNKALLNKVPVKPSGAGTNPAGTGASANTGDE